MQARFERAISVYPRSLAAQRLRADMSTVNSYYWVGRLAEGGLAKELKSQDAAADPLASLGLADYYERRLGHDITSLQALAKIATQWRRLMTLVMMASALERYLVGIAQVAIESDPLLRAGFPKIVDGAQLLKYGVAMPKRDVRCLTVGEWPQRISAYRELFGTVPPNLENSVGELEVIRKTRNKAAHALGVDDGFDACPRTGSVVTPLLVEARRPHLTRRASISEARLTRLMGVVQSVADAIDDHLLGEYIGAYEVLAIYLEWKQDPDRFESHVGIKLVGHTRQQDQRFGNVLGVLFGAGLGKARLRQMNVYIETL